MKNNSYAQDLFFLNLPDSNKTYQNKLGYLSALKKKSPLFKKIEDPCFIFTGNGRIEKLERLKFRTKMLKKIKQRTINIFLYEPICIRIYGQLNCGFYSELKYDLSRYHNTTIDEFESIRIFIQRNNLQHVKIFTTENNVSQLRTLYPDLNIVCFDIFLHHLWIYGRGESNLPNKITKTFWCGNWRYTLNRHLMMSYLVHYQGNYSWNYHVNYKTIKKNYWFDFEFVRKEDSYKYKRIRDGMDILNKTQLSLVPEEFEGDAIKIPFLSATCYPTSFNSNKNKESFLDSYKECFCAIVNETRYAQPFSGFSEKTLDPLVSRLPFILVAPPRTLEYVKSFGFKTFDRWWDESYDLEKDHTKRLIKIFNVIDYIGNKSIDELNTIYNDMSSVLDHNREIIKKLNLVPTPGIEPGSTILQTVAE